MEENLSFFEQIFVDFMGNLIGPLSRLWPGYVFVFIFIAYSIYRFEGKPTKRFRQFLFPKEIYFHSSSFTDIKLFCTNGLLNAVGVVVALVSKTAISIWVISIMGGEVVNTTAIHPLLIAMLLFFVGDLITYWVHRIHHTAEPLWIFHAVHHSAEVMSPITAYRHHPVYSIFSRTTRAIIFGLLEGLLLATLISSLNYSTLLGVNILRFIYSITGNNLRHSHIWLSYGPVISRFLISPAMHQIHHSRDPKHFNKNYGNALAIFDWMFGSLYIPKQREYLQFGLSDQNGSVIQPHNGLRESFVLPFKQLGRMILKREKKSSYWVPNTDN